MVRMHTFTRILFSNIPEPDIGCLETSFSPGDFRSFSVSFKAKKSSAVTVPEAESSELSKANVDDLEGSAGVYNCPQDGCTRAFQRLWALDKHLSLEQCSKSLERQTLMDLAKVGYKSRLEEGVGALPTIRASMHSLSSDQSLNGVPAKEGWALRTTKKAYRFSEKQKSYLLAKFRIGQTTGRKLDGEVVAREMRRSRGPDGARLFMASEFLSTTQIASYFSRLNAAARQRDPDEMDIQAANEEANFACARSMVESSEPQHPIVYDQYDLCAMGDAELKSFKLPTLQRMCEDLGLDIPPRAQESSVPRLAQRPCQQLYMPP